MRRERAKALAIMWMLNAIRLQVKATMYGINKQHKGAESIMKEADEFAMEALAKIEEARDAPDH